MYLKKNSSKKTILMLASLAVTFITNNPTNLSTLPSPYNSLKTILPFDDHGWYFNEHAFIKLFEHNNIANVIEIGSWLGKSTRHIASLLPNSGKLYAVDTWKGTLIPWYQVGLKEKLKTLYEQFLSNIIHAQLTDKVIPIRYASTIAATHLISLKQQANLVYIDADHSKKAALEDMHAWYPYVSGRRGILCGDDWQIQSVKEAARIFARQHSLTIYADEHFWIFIENGEYNELPLLDAPDSIWKIIQ